MCQKLKYFQVIYILLTPLIFTCLLEANNSTDEVNAFLIKVCENTRERTKQNLFHVVSLNPNFDITPLINYFHQQSITLVLSDRVKSTSIFLSIERPKIILFVLNDFSDILNLILNSASYDGQIQVAFNRYLDRDSNLNFPNNSLSECCKPYYSVMQNFPNYCIMHDLGSGGVLKDHKRRCDYTMKVPDSSLNGDSVLSNEVFSQIRGLSVNNVWNSQNYIIFMIPGLKDQRGYLSGILKATGGPKSLQVDFADNEMNNCVTGELLFVFKFIWRTFKGHKTVICLGRVCFWYDPFYEKIHKYSHGSLDRYFDFSWFSMNGKKLKMLMLHPEKQLLEFNAGSSMWLQFFYKATSILENKYNGNIMIDPLSLTIVDEIHNQHILQLCMKNGIDIYVVEHSIGMKSSDLSQFDFLPTVETGYLCFMVPRRGLMPQYLTVFKCFTTLVWICMLMTLGMFLLMHYVYINLQIKLFHYLYSEDELIHYRATSTLLAIYRYFLCISHPRLFIAKLMSGKILFAIFVFSSVIFATLLQSGMVNMMSKRVRYSDIDTLQELEASDSLIQNDTSLDTGFLTGESQLDWINDRLINSFQHEFEIMTDAYLSFDYHPYTFMKNGSILRIDNVTEGLSAASVANSIKSLDMMMRSDAFLTTSLAAFMYDKDFFLTHGFSDQLHEYHYVNEHVVSYPFLYPILKNSFYRDALGDILTRYLESGIKSKAISDAALYRDSYLTEPEGLNGSQSLRPFSMNDLQIAFICLAVGLFLSVIVFILELLYQF